jgi:hypothetical protein
VFEELAASAWTEIVAAELFFQQLVAVDDAIAGLNLRFGRIAAASFAHGLERSVRRYWVFVPWGTSEADGWICPETPAAG